jgi:hypothetical protein
MAVGIISLPHMQKHATSLLQADVKINTAELFSVDIATTL